jgi:hypothetical protein
MAHSSEPNLEPADYEQKMQERSIPGSRPVLLLEIFLWQVFLLFAL